jgi:hypothetical protein
MKDGQPEYGADPFFLKEVITKSLKGLEGD